MTKKTLLNKLWNGAKKTAAVAGLIAAPLLYSNNANAQNVKFEEGQTVQVKDPHGGVTQAPVLNIHGIYYFEIKDQNGGNSKLWVAETCPRIYSYGNNEPTYTKGLVLKEQLAKFKDKENGDEKNVGELKLTPKGKLGINGPKMNELIQKEEASSNLGVTNMSDKGRVTGIYTIVINGHENFVPYMNNKTMENLVLDGTNPKDVADFMGLPVKDSKGVYTDQGIDTYGNVSLGNANDGFIFVADSSESVKAYMNPDSLVKFLRVSGYPDNSTITNLKQTGQVVDFGEWEEREATKDQKEKTKSNVHARLRLGFMYVLPKGIDLSLNPQLKVSDNSYVGIRGFYSNSTKTIEDAAQDPAIRKLVNAPLNMYFVNTGAKVSTTEKVKDNFGVGVNYSYVGPSWETSIEAGLVNRSVNKSMTSSGSEYLEVNGVQDSSSVEKYNETNTSNSKENDAYFSIGGELYPFPEGALKNVSIGADAGYIFGNHSGAFGKAGIKYTFGNKSEESNTTQ